MRSRWKLAKGVLTDKASALANAGFALGTIIGPIVGGRCYDVGGYRYACDVMCVSCAVVCVLNFCFIFLPDILSKKKQDTVTEEADEDSVKVETC